jgi:class 3 adenylate cyclase
MTDRSSRRKLTAIFSADAVGYSRLMAADEAATVTLKSYRDNIVRLVRHGRRVVNAPGDALLAEFPSAVEAVQAAIEIQQSVEGHNIELEADRRMQFRIGVNLGDVIRGRRHDLRRRRQHCRAHGGPRRGRRRLHLLHCLRRRGRQAFLRISGRAARQEHCEAGPRLARAR